MRVIAIGDVHGEITKLQNLIKELNLDLENDTLVFLGDYIDRGENPCAVVQFLRELQSKYPSKVVCLRGNHEQMAIDNREWGDSTWLYNGCNSTLNSYDNYFGNVAQVRLDSDIEWFKTLPYYYETKNNIFVHGGIEPNKSMEDQDLEYMLWAREQYLYDGRPFPKTVISGHTPSVLHCKDSTKAYYTLAKNIIIDTGACFNGCLTTCIVEEDGKYNFKRV